MADIRSPSFIQAKRRLWGVVAFFALGSVACTLVACSIAFHSANSSAPVMVAEDANQEHWQAAQDDDQDGVDSAYMAHAKLFQESQYPSAFACGACHEDHFREWSVSQHAYAQLSPTFNAMQATINKLTSGTNGDFCIRCHTQVGMALGESVHMSNMDRAQVSREGVTCITCHRMADSYGKISGRFPVDQGPLTEPIKGPTGNVGLKQVLAKAMSNRVVTDETSIGHKIHRDVTKFFALTEPSFCGTCHDVTLFNGFRLEEAFSEYKHSPAVQEGLTCQDCHMGREQGVPSPLEDGWAAIVAGEITRDRKLTQHNFAGPDFSLVHPLIFPFNADVYQRWEMREMITFDWKAGWGTDAFEDRVEAGEVSVDFPKPWDSVDERYEARLFVRKNQELLNWAEGQRRTVLRNGYLKPRIFDIKHADDLSFSVETGNGTMGHNVPTGFSAERVTWLHVRVIDANGKTIFASGDTDPNGDIRDDHSLYVKNGELPRDPFLFSLQSKFMVRMNRGGESEEILPVNHSIDPLPYVRPARIATTLTGRPQGARIEKRGIPAGRKVVADYRLTSEQLANAAWPLKINVELKAAMVPVHLVDRIKDIGFDYNMSAREIGDNLRDGQMVVWSVEQMLSPQTTSSEGGTGE